jgi:hypothetical protein
MSEVKNKSILFRFCVNKENYYVYGVSLKHAQYKLKQRLEKNNGAYFITDASIKQDNGEWSRINFN